MKINEVTDVVQHPAVAKEAEFTTLLQSGEDRWEDIVEFIMDDSNAESRRLDMLRHLDELQGDARNSYDTSELQDFMTDTGTISPEEADEIARDLGFPPYHLKSVDENQDDDIPTGEYEICDKCFGDGCPDCEEGLVDVTGEFKLPNFDDFK